MLFKKKINIIWLVLCCEGAWYTMFHSIICKYIMEHSNKVFIVQSECLIRIEVAVRWSCYFTASSTIAKFRADGNWFYLTESFNTSKKVKNIKLILDYKWVGFTICLFWLWYQVIFINILYFGRLGAIFYKNCHKKIRKYLWYYFYYAK